jgi:hypothetical protein
MIQTVELTTFRLKKRSCEEFINANSGIDAGLIQQEEFISRRIAERDDGAILDIYFRSWFTSGVDDCRNL